MRQCCGGKIAWNQIGKEHRYGGKTQDTWWESGEGVKVMGVVKRHWPLWLEHPRGEYHTIPCLHCSKGELHRLVSHRAGRNLMSSLFICQVGAKVGKTDKIQFGSDKRQNSRRGGSNLEQPVSHVLFPMLAHHPRCSGWRQMCSFSYCPSVPEASLLVLWYQPWCPRTITWSTNSPLSSFHPSRSFVLFSIPVVASSSWEDDQGRVCEGEKDFRIYSVWEHPGKNYSFLENY